MTLKPSKTLVPKSDKHSYTFILITIVLYKILSFMPNQTFVLLCKRSNRIIQVLIWIVKK